MFLNELDITSAIILFIIFTITIAYGGTRLSKAADQLADLTGIGEAVFGAIFLGGVTSISGIITSVTAAYDNHPELAMSNAIGGIAAQTVFLSVADIVYKRANLEHAAASFANLMQGVLLIILLGFILLVMSGPDINIGGIHPASFVLLISYVIGSKFISHAKEVPMWAPTKTKETVKDIPDANNIKNLKLRTVIIKFTLFAILVAISGFVVAKSGIAIADQTGLSETFVGGILTAIATSLTELIVSIAAVRQGALTLAVANVIGGNAFDMLFVAFSDFAYLEGSIYHALTSDQIFIVSMTIMMTSILLLGLLHRQKDGPIKIGWESLLIIIIFLGGYLVLFL